MTTITKEQERIEVVKMVAYKQALRTDRMARLAMWLNLQPLGPSHMKAIKAAENFRVRLKLWADSETPGLVAPSFDYAPGRV